MSDWLTGDVMWKYVSQRLAEVYDREFAAANAQTLDEVAVIDEKTYKYLAKKARSKKKETP